MQVAADEVGQGCRIPIKLLCSLSVLGTIPEAFGLLYSRYASRVISYFLLRNRKPGGSALCGFSLRGCCALERNSQAISRFSPARAGSIRQLAERRSRRGREFRSTSSRWLRLARKACWVGCIPEPRDQQRAGKQAHDPAAADFVRFFNALTGAPAADLALSFIPGTAWPDVICSLMGRHE